MTGRCRRLALVCHDEKDLCLGRASRERREEDGGVCYRDCYSKVGQW